MNDISSFSPFFFLQASWKFIYVFSIYDALGLSFLIRAVSPVMCARLTNCPPPAVHLGMSERPQDRSSAAHSRVFSVVARVARPGGKRAGARVVSSDKEVTNCLARRAPGRLCDVLGTKLARRGWPVRSARIVTERRRRVSTRVAVDRDLWNNANTKQPGSRRIYRRATWAPGNARSFRIHFNFWN